MSKELIIRIALPKDSEFLKRNSHISEEIINRKIEWQEIFVAEIQEIPVGFLQLEYLWSSVPYISLISVLPEYQKQGIGKSLLKFTEDFLRHKNFKSLYSSSQANESEPQAWHRHVGFEECGIIAGINDGIGEIFFCKNLL